MLHLSRLRSAGKFSRRGNGDAAPLEQAAARLIPQLSAMVEAFHEKFAQDAELALLTRNGVAAVKREQVEHWRDLLAAPTGEAVKARARRIGVAHAKAGVSPRFYLQSYLFFFESLVERAGAESSETLLALARALFADMELALAAFVENAEDQMVQRSAQHMVKSVEEEVRVAHQTAKSRADDLTEIVGELSRSMEELRRGFEMMEGSSRTNRDEIKSADLASALERAAEALRLTSLRLTRVESAISEVLLRSGKPAAAHFADLQELDRSAQEVAGLAEFIDQLGRRTPGAVTVDVAGAAQKILLHDLARFLGRHPTPTDPSHAEDDDIFFAQG